MFGNIISKYMMAQQQATPPHSFGFKSIQLFKEETLGIGSYGKVCRAKCDNLLCAAKIIHETIFDPMATQQMPRRHEHRLPIRRFEQECEFLNTIRHPNVIQYLAMYQDPDTGLPVLLMELMDESLTHFLETATRSIPYHIQVNICHDIALALMFLHANGIVHRDLSSNNVLLISNVRAKVTDFGMAKLSDLNTRISHLTFTMCPGTDVYMPPEAVQDRPVYTEKIDCFSFGVLVIQMLTHQFPNPGDRTQRVEMNHPGLPRGTLMVCIPEIDRRQNHISQIDPNNTLLPIALDCLKDRDVERPSAQQLCERIAALKESNTYAESLRATQTMVTQRELQELREQHTTEIQNLQKIQLREREAKEHEIQDLLWSHDEAIVAKERENKDLMRQLEQCTHRMNGKEQELEELERKIFQMQLGTEGDSQKYADVTDMKLRWTMGTAPQCIYRYCNAVVDKSKVYFNANGNEGIYCYNVNTDLWTQLPDCPKEYSSFVVINNMLTAIGGLSSNDVYSLKSGEWVEEFPPMPTACSSATSICSNESLLIVVGGRGLTCGCPVEIMNIASHQWCVAAGISMKDTLDSSCASVIICGDQLYVLGALHSKSAYTCSLIDLLQSCQSSSKSNTATPRQLNVWRELADLPLFNSTCILLCGHLLAIGGENTVYYSGKNSDKSVYAYKSATNSWEMISRMSTARRFCFAFILPTTNELMVVGGLKKISRIDSVEFARLL